jgi:hypothetical protein
VDIVGPDPVLDLVEKLRRSRVFEVEMSLLPVSPCHSLVPECCLLEQVRVTRLRRTSHVDVVSQTDSVPRSGVTASGHCGIAVGFYHLAAWVKRLLAPGTSWSSWSVVDLSRAMERSAM